ncbi:tetratricopeptide repeat protein [Dokdonella sp.]|uniref:tetratricopeptide repeat protein n=1 Tax=Dokdonella sp. TaxID=2291710 RepID=UPI0025BD520A|nr:tetratricopeptide repeat protein [Dokdonella sp.]MBX3691763.1 tetratricopeptide repeat protein [Dokdonella sp.]MCW5568090.1 tetratricopeptide repeat protein [Dokdonella sp.]
MAREFTGDTGRLTVMIRNALAETYVRGGRLAEAEPLAEEGLGIAKAHHGDTSLATGTAWRARGRLRIAQHRDAEARADLAEARAVFERMGRGGEVYLPTLDPLLKELDARAGKR